MAEYMLDNNLACDNSHPIIVSRNYKIMMCLDIDDWNARTTQELIGTGVYDKYTFNGKKVFDYFEIEDISDCRNEYASGVHKKALASYVGAVRMDYSNPAKTEWEISVIVHEIINSIR